MDAVKHTPGPWVVEDPFDFELTVVANGQNGPADWTVVASCAWPDEDDHDITSGEVKANARLIAAAPDLYTALRDFVRGADLGLVSVRADNAARTALAKAEGRS